MIVLLVAKDIKRFSAFIKRLVFRREIELLQAATADEGFMCLKNSKIDLAIVDEQLSDMSGIAFIRQLVKTHPLVNTAIVSSLTKEDFHEATEGLGVLMQLPQQPQTKNAEDLLATLEKIGILLGPAVQQKRGESKS